MGEDPAVHSSAVTAPVVAADDPRREDVRALLERHLAFTGGATPPQYSFALNVDRLADPAVTFFSARREGRLLGVAALKRLDEEHAELKSMHTAEAERGRGVARALLEHIVAHARACGYRRVSLETGTTEEFLAARRLYAKAGFVPCGEFGDYRASPYNTFMTLALRDS